MADQEFLASFGVDIDESGVSRLQQILTENKSLGADLAASFNAAAEGVRAFKESVSTDLPSLFGSGYGNVTENLFGSAGGLKIGLNMTEPKKEIAGFTAEAKKEIPLAANASGIVSAARTALENVRSLFSETFTINVRASTNTDDGDGKKDSRNDSRNRDSTGSTFLRMSSGGRFSRPTSVQVAEDGDAEYIIPVKKENRALPLLRQLLGELSPAARASLTGGSAIPTGSHVIPGFGTPGERASGSFLVENGRQPRAGEARVEGSPVYNNQNVSAPVTINVNAMGSNAEAIGQTIYNTAERYLLRTLKSPC